MSSLRDATRMTSFLSERCAIEHILTDLAVARQERECADKDLAEVLANLTFEILD